MVSRLEQFSGVSGIVNHRMNQWELARMVEGKKERQAHLADGMEIDYITISRELGSGGEDVARGLAKLMGWDYYDKEILDCMSEKMDVHVKALECVDEQATSWIHDSLAALLSVKTAGHVEQLSYYKNLTKALLVIGHHGKAVIVGRGAAMVLLGDRGFNVRITAPFPLRCQRIAEIAHLNIDQASEIVRKSDETQYRFVKNYLQKDIRDPSHYDLICSTEKLSPMAVARLIWRAFDQRIASMREVVEAEEENVVDVVSRHIQQWQEGRTPLKKPSQVKSCLASGVEINYVTVSRQVGSGGRLISRMLSEIMDWQYYDRQILDYMSKNMDVRIQALESVDEQTAGWIEKYIQPFFSVKLVERVHPSSYYKHLAKVLLVIAQHGHAIIMGRGAGILLPRDKGLSVRITAPFELRCERIVRKKNISLDAARAFVKKTDKDQKNFIKEYLGKDINDPQYYDLICNTQKLYPASVARLIDRAFEQRLQSQQEED